MHINKIDKIKNKIIYIAVILTITMSFVSNFIIANSLEDARKEYEEILAKQKQNVEQTQGIEKEIAQHTYEIAQLDKKVTEATISLKDVEKKLENINKRVTELENDLQNISQKYNSAQEVYQTRIKVMYEKGIPSMIELFLSSKDMTEFFSKLNVLNGILEHDRTLMNNMKTQKEYTDYVKKDIENQKIQIEQLKYDKEKTTQTLENSLKAKESKLNELAKSKQSLEKQAELLTKQENDSKRKVEAEVAKRLSEGNLFDGVFVGKFTWPIPGQYHITAAFDDKDYLRIIGMHHNGVDVGTPVGVELVAVADGKVIISGYNSGGYGNYVAIDHGKDSTGTRYVSLYGHLSSRTVKVNDIVVKGTTIGYSGNSGFSTGPHLHFEINKSTGGALRSIDAMDFFEGSGAPFTYDSNRGKIKYPFGEMNKYQYSKELKSHIANK